ncbi:MAG: hypothetical protein PF569_05895 [Candidatus Woesearchaeota archaeon]|jgi:hypothetical protein|nr:hypothetical protein [Candidatus Woesearchaeota archaeon]
MKFDTHKFLYTLFDNGTVIGHSILYLNKDNEDEIIKIYKIEIGTSPVSFKVYNEDGKRYIIPFIRVKKIFHNDTLVWENTDFNISDTKIIKGFK